MRLGFGECPVVSPSDRSNRVFLYDSGNILELKMVKDKSSKIKVRLMNPMTLELV